jgi:hypothetical protein
LIGFLAGGVLFCQEHNLAHHDAVNRRGDHAMGFSHEKTTHHFRLAKDGGSIEVEANDAKDTENRDAIRQHLSHIAEMFSAGNFETPMFIHDQVPPGVPAMKRLKGQIRYEFETMERGGRVRISSKNPKAVAVVHDFLRFQISDHQTGDPVNLTNRP